jgi:hypothetical protein
MLTDNEELASRELIAVIDALSDSADEAVSDAITDPVTHGLELWLTILLEFCDADFSEVTVKTDDTRDDRLDERLFVPRSVFVGMRTVRDALTEDDAVRRPEGLRNHEVGEATEADAETEKI